MLVVIGSLLLAQASAANATQATQSPPASPCTSETHGQFDFWIGEWDVYPNGTDDLVAQSRIEKLHAGCVIREHWMPLVGPGGSSLNNYDPESGRWHQTWVDHDVRVDFEGGLTDERMVLTGYWSDFGPNGEDGLVRMTYSVTEQGHVRQHGEVSYDFGLTWEKSFDLIYRPREE